MAFDKYKAVWVSHSSMGDFLKCPRAYYLHNVYKDPKTGRKINIVGPALSLGLAVHNTLESLVNFPAEERMKRDLLVDYETNWKQVSGKKGGFLDADEEAATKERGKKMIKRVMAHPGPLTNKTVRLKPGHNNMPPNIILSEDDNIILCGLVDWLEYVPEDDSVRIIDFKTGKRDESDDSLQLPIYLLLLHELQKRKVSGAAYWYLDRDDELIEKELPDLDDARTRVLDVAQRVKEAREKKAYNCPRGEGGCFACRPYEAILRGEAEYVGVGVYVHVMYVVSKK